MSQERKTKSYESVALNKLKVGKAGFVIYGKNAEGQLCVLATYTQGRFEDSPDKFYGLAKGAINEGESAIAGARRETLEETGIDVEALLGEKNFRKLAMGEDIASGVKNPYGIRVNRAYGEPSDFAYRSASGHMHR